MLNSKKIFFTFLIFAFFCFEGLFAQSENLLDQITLGASEYRETKNFQDFLNSCDIVLEAEPGFYINPLNTELHSGPTAPIYPLSFGILWPNYTFAALQPSFSFFYMYNLWYDGTAYPAEIENRTSTTLSFILTVPVVFSFYLKNNKVQLISGISVFIRHGILSQGVSPDDSGYTGSAEQDLIEINKWFWQNAHFLYLNTGFSWLIQASDKFRVGPVLNIYYPIGSFVSGEKFLGTIVSFGIKFSL